MTASCLILAIGIASLGDGLESARAENPPPAGDEFLIVPLRIHILQSRDLDLADCKLRDADIARIAGKLNAIWSPARIRFGIESILREPAAQTGRFLLLAELNAGQLGIQDFQLLLPKPSQAFDGLNAFVLHELPFNGAYLGGDNVILQEKAELDAVAGGTDEPVARVLGHTLGVALGLRPKRGPRTGLLALGTTGVALEVDECERARRIARTVPGAMNPAELRQAADAAQAAGQADRAKRLRGWLAEVPTETKAQKGARRDPDAPSPTPRSCKEADNQP
jgi:hypothetical protein